jgi:hypothetical protein
VVLLRLLTFTQLANRSLYRLMQRCATFVCSTACGQNMNTATGRKQIMESLWERNKIKGHSIVASNLKWEIFQFFNCRNRK